LFIHSIIILKNSIVYQDDGVNKLKRNREQKTQ